MTLQEQRVDAPTRVDLEAWKKQLEADLKDQQRVVEQCTSNLEQAKREATLIGRSIEACNKMILALKDAGIG